LSEEELIDWADVLVTSFTAVLTVPNELFVTVVQEPISEDQKTSAIVEIATPVKTNFDSLEADVTKVVNNGSLTASIQTEVDKKFVGKEWLSEFDFQVTKNPSREMRQGTASPVASPTVVSASPTAENQFTGGAISAFSCPHFFIFGLSLFALIL